MTKVRILGYIGEHPDLFKTTGSDWNVSRAWVNELKIIRPESVFQQRVEDFKVDILVETRIKLEEVRSGFAFMKNRYAITPTLRLRYCFDFRPCHMECHFAGVILDEADSLQARYPGAFPVDKYLIPVMSSEDYAWLADAIHRDCYQDEIRRDEPIEPEKWIRSLAGDSFLLFFSKNDFTSQYP